MKAKLTDDQKDWLRRVTERSGKQVSDSDIFVSICSGKALEEPQWCLEMGFAVALDKPIYLLVPDDLVLPENLRRLARGIERYKPDDMPSFNAASHRLIRAAQAEGSIK